MIKQLVLLVIAASPATADAQRTVRTPNSEPVGIDRFFRETTKGLSPAENREIRAGTEAIVDILRAMPEVSTPTPKVCKRVTGEDPYDVVALGRVTSEVGIAFTRYIDPAKPDPQRWWTGCYRRAKHHYIEYLTGITIFINRADHILRGPPVATRDELGKIHEVRITGESRGQPIYYDCCILITHGRGDYLLPVSRERYLKAVAGELRRQQAETQQKQASSTAWTPKLDKWLNETKPKMQKGIQEKLAAFEKQGMSAEKLAEYRKIYEKGLADQEALIRELDVKQATQAPAVEAGKATLVEGIQRVRQQAVNRVDAMLQSMSAAERASPACLNQTGDGSIVNFEFVVCGARGQHVVEINPQYFDADSRGALQLLLLSGPAMSQKEFLEGTRDADPATRAYRTDERKVWEALDLNALQRLLR